MHATGAQNAHPTTFMAKMARPQVLISSNAAWVHVKASRIKAKKNDMGWLRLVESIKLLVSFAEYSLFYRALLQKRPMILRSLLIVATP